MTSDGTFSLDMNPELVLGTNDNQDVIQWVRSDDKNRLVFENAQEILGVSETHGEKEKKT